MKFARFSLHSEQVVRSGILQNNQLYEISGDMMNEWGYTGQVYEEREVKLAAPLCPNQIIGIGLNYVPPGETPEWQQTMPVFFFKPVSSVIGPNDEIVLPKDLTEAKFEAEIAVVIGKAAFQVEPEDALNYVFGYTVGNDLTAPHYFHPNGHWTLGKVSPTFTPLGPFIETELALHEAVVRSGLNEKRKQDSPTSLMIVSIPHIISYLSQLMLLQPGDVLLSGAPAGADFLRRGDTIECSVEGIGKLRNRVRN
ncbi:MAG: ureidoglycolate lyase [Bacilli bacterium]|nr:ureidoglycolate lyase [Bacilli bacterium]